MRSHSLRLTTLTAFVLSALFAGLAGAAAPTPLKTETKAVVDGEIVPAGGSFPDKVALKLATPIKVVNTLHMNGKVVSDQHDGEVLQRLEVYLGDPTRFPNPKVGTKGPFEITFDCPASGCSVTTISKVAGASKPSQAATPAPSAVTPDIPAPSAALKPLGSL